MPAVSRVFRRVRAGVSADCDTDRVAVVLGRGDARACGAPHYINYRFIMEVSLSEEAGGTGTPPWRRCSPPRGSSSSPSSARACVSARTLSRGTSSRRIIRSGLIVFSRRHGVRVPAGKHLRRDVGAGADRRRAGTTTRALRQTPRPGSRASDAARRAASRYARASLAGRSIAVRHGDGASSGPPVRFRDRRRLPAGARLVRRSSSLRPPRGSSSPASTRRTDRACARITARRRR